LKPFEQHTRKPATLLRALRLFWFAPILALLAAGCNLSKEEKVEYTVSFDRIADSLKQFDAVMIVLKSQSGAPIDTVFNQGDPGIGCASS